MSAQIGVITVKVPMLPPDLQAAVLAFLRGEPYSLPTAEPISPTAKRPKRSAPKAGKVDVLLDTQIVAELLLAGIDPEPRKRAERRAAKQGGAWRSIKIRLADGFECVTGSYIGDDDQAKAQAIRFARARAMEVAFARNRNQWLADCARLAETMRAQGIEDWIAPVEPDPFRFVKVPGKGYSVSVRTCEVAAVESVEILPERAPSWRLARPKVTLITNSCRRDGLYTAVRRTTTVFEPDELKIPYRLRDISEVEIERIRRRHAKALRAQGCHVEMIPPARRRAAPEELEQAA